MYLLYPLHFLAKEIRSPSSHCVICTNTFYTPFLSALLRNPKRKSIHLLYDLFPDVLVTAGKAMPNGLLARGIMWIVNFTMRNSDANVTLGKRLNAHIAARLPKWVPNEAIPVGTDCSLFRGSPISSENNKTINIIYCGNFGHLHEVETLKTLFKHPEFQSLPIRFRFHGTGAGMIQLKRECNVADKVSFAKGLSSVDWAQTMSSYPIGLVTMRHGAEKVLLPSKTYSAMAAGQAILAICPIESDLADLVLEHDCGWVVEPCEIESLIETLDTISKNHQDLHQKRVNAQNAARTYYDASPVAHQWHNLITKLQLKKCPAL